MNTDTEKVQTPEEIKKQLAKEHELWLNMPMTQQALKLLNERGTRYEDSLIESVMKETNESTQIKLRACISTCKAVKAILFDTNQFVETSTTKQ